MAEGSGECAWDFSTILPPDFAQCLRQAHISGKDKGTAKFRRLRKQVMESLPTAPSPGAATYICQCLEAVLALEPPHNEGFFHLMTSSLRNLDAAYKPPEDVAVARKLAAQTLKDALSGTIKMEAGTLVRLIVVFGIQLADVGECFPDDKCLLPGENDERSAEEKGKAIVAPFILSLVKERSYTGAVTLLKQFNIHSCSSREFVTTLVEAGEVELASHWAAHLGVQMCCFLVQHCLQIGLYDVAHRFVKIYKLEKKFPDEYLLYKQSSLRNLARRGLWDAAESVARTNASLEEYLVKLAVEGGNAIEAGNLRRHFSKLEIPTCPDNSQFLQLADVIPLDKVFWVSSVEDLATAAEHLSQSVLVGFDSEWKAKLVKGGTENKVSILQLATEEMVFIFDLITLCEKEPDALNSCLTTVFLSPHILKLGYAVSHDLMRLLLSYKELKCFSNFESVLDLQIFAGSSRGGLSGLAKLSLGAFLDKESRMSDWEQRPLTVKQLHYAALDAAVLPAVFKYLRTNNGQEDVRDYQPFLKSFSFPSLVSPLKFVYSSSTDDALGLEDTVPGKDSVTNSFSSNSITAGTTNFNC